MEEIKTPSQQVREFAIQEVRSILGSEITPHRGIPISEIPTNVLISFLKHHKGVGKETHRRNCVAFGFIPSKKIRKLSDPLTSYENMKQNCRESARKSLLIRNKKRGMEKIEKLRKILHPVDDVKS